MSGIGIYIPDADGLEGEAIILRCPICLSPLKKLGGRDQLVYECEHCGKRIKITDSLNDKGEK